MARVRIDLPHGIVEAEGSEEFLLEIYRDFKERIADSFGTAEDNDDAPIEEEKEEEEGTDSPVKDGRPVARVSRERRPSKSRTPVLVKNLDLVTKGDRVGLRDFLGRYRELKTAQERIAVSVYYLAKIANLPTITIDHVYTCFKHIEARVPAQFDQALWDTARRKGWIELSSVDDIKLPLAGENFVEHDLEKAQTVEA